MRPNDNCLKLLAFSLALAGAQPALADPADLAGVSHLAWSDAIRLRALGAAAAGNQIDPGLTRALQRELDLQGYYSPPRQITPIARQVWAMPLVAWDGNINGGLIKDRFDFNGLIFEADPSYRAKAGLVLGGGLGGMTRLAWDEGRWIDLTAQVEIGYSPKHHVARQDLWLQACSRNHLAGWSFLDFCASGNRSFRELGNDQGHRVETAYRQVAASKTALHEFGIKLARVDSQTRDQNRIGFSVESLWHNSATQIGLTLGEEIPDATVLRQRIDFGIKSTLFDRKIGFDLWGQKAEGSAFLGTPREDKTWGLGVSADLRPGIDLRLGYSDSQSTAAIADYKQVTLDLRFDPLIW